MPNESGITLRRELLGRIDIDCDTALLVAFNLGSMQAFGR
jgi:hypothetical protein